VEYWFAMMRVVVPRTVEVEPECVSRRFQDEAHVPPTGALEPGWRTAMLSDGSAVSGE